MQVIKRNGKKESVNVEKIISRIEKQCYNLDAKYVVPFEVAQKVIEGIYDGVTSRQLDELAAETAASLTTKHPDYAILASRLAVTSLHKETKKSFSETMKELYNNTDKYTNKKTPLLSKEFYDVVKEHAEELDSAIVYNRDFNYDYFGYKTLERSYLMKLNNRVVERPQHMIMRVSVAIHGEDIKKAIETYNLISEGYFTHATPTLFNAGSVRPQMSSCFLMQIQNDSIGGIYNTLGQIAEISKFAGGIGVAISNVRAKGSRIRGTNGQSDGLIPMLKVFNETGRYVNQGGKRKGSIAVYLEPWHADVMEFLDLKKNTGKEEVRARDLFLAMWMNDLFMERVQKNEDWSLMCPDECPGLQDVYGKDFEKLYVSYEKEERYKRRLPAREVWNKILESQIETGVPYILYKDVANEKSNQKNIGTIKTSNLCAEILEVVSPEEIAVCNLASICLPKFVNKGHFSFKKLEDVAYTATINLNKVIDKNFYPVEEARKSNMRHRPIGLGVQGLADVFFKLQLPFESEEAKELNKQIFETIYYGAVRASIDLAKKDGPYESYEGSPASKGQLQFDMWGVTPSDRYDWNKVKEDMKKYGIRNSLLSTIMPTASTASVFGNEASCEAQTSNIYSRKVLAGEFIIVNKHLVKELVKRKLWNDTVRQQIIRDNGSVQKINEIPQDLKDIYKTVWEIKQKAIIDMAVDRGPYIDQTQSMNIFMESPNFAKLTAMQFYAWGRRENPDFDASKPESEKNPKYIRLRQNTLKTGNYYLRTRAATDAIKFTVDQNLQKKTEETQIDQGMKDISCSLDNPQDCEACGS